MNGILVGMGVLLPVSVLAAWVWALHRRVQQIELMLGISERLSRLEGADHG